MTTTALAAPGSFPPQQQAAHSRHPHKHRCKDHNISDSHLKNQSSYLIDKK